MQPDPDAGPFCNPYGPCEEWCSLFATWAWQQGGLPIPSYGSTGDVYSWADANGRVLVPTRAPVAGDAVFYGTGPSVTGHMAVVVHGPSLPQDSLWYNGSAVDALAQPEGAGRPGTAGAAGSPR